MAVDNLEIWRLIRSKVTDEDKWIQQRVSWLIAANAFLFAAYGAVILASARQLARPPGVRPFLLALLPCVGSLLALAMLIGLIGAAIALHRIRQEWEGLVPEEDERSQLPDIHSTGASLWLGRGASIGLAVLLGMLWFVLLAVTPMLAFSR